MPRHFWEIAIVTGLLPSRDSEIIGGIVRIKNTNAIFCKTNAILCKTNAMFPIEYTYHNTNQIDKARKQKLRLEAAVTGELKRKYEF